MNKSKIKGKNMNKERIKGNEKKSFIDCISNLILLDVSIIIK